MTAPNDPTPRPRTHPGYPTRTKVIIVVVLAFAAVLFSVGVLATDTDPDDGTLAVSGTGDAATVPVPVTIAPGVDARRPRDGAEVLAQERITLDLAAGWTGELTLVPENGDPIEVPDDQLDTNSLGELTFRPAPGKVIERLPSGEVCVDAVIWDQVRGRAASERTESWCFDVT